MRSDKAILETCTFLKVPGCLHFCAVFQSSLQVCTTFLCTCTLLSGTCRWGKWKGWGFYVIWVLRFWTSSLGKSSECSKMWNFLLQEFFLFYRFFSVGRFQCLHAFIGCFGKGKWWDFILMKWSDWLGFYFCDESCSKGGVLWRVWCYQWRLNFGNWKLGPFGGWFRN